MGFHAIAFDDITDEDEPLHWHEFDAVAWVIDKDPADRPEHLAADA